MFQVAQVVQEEVEVEELRLLMVALVLQEILAAVGAAVRVLLQQGLQEMELYRMVVQEQPEAMGVLDQLRVPPLVLQDLL